MLEESAVVEAAAAAELALNDNFPTQTQKSAKACQWQAGRMPIVTESFGGWHGIAAKQEVLRLIAVLARHSGQDCDAGRRLWARANLPFCCSGGVLAILANRMPDFPTTGIDGSYEAWL